MSPRNVRNFWLELTVDGRTSRIETGPQAKDGGFSLVILQRDNGNILRAMEVDGFAQSDGKLRCEARLPQTKEQVSISFTTER